MSSHPTCPPIDLLSNANQPVQPRCSLKIAVCLVGMADCMTLRCTTPFWRGRATPLEGKHPDPKAPTKKAPNCPTHDQKPRNWPCYSSFRKGTRVILPTRLARVGLFLLTRNLRQVRILLTRFLCRPSVLKMGILTGSNPAQSRQSSSTLSPILPCLFSSQTCLSTRSPNHPFFAFYTFNSHICGDTDTTAELNTLLTTFLHHFQSHYLYFSLTFHCFFTSADTVNLLFTFFLSWCHLANSNKSRDQSHFFN